MPFSGRLGFGYRGKNLNVRDANDDASGLFFPVTWLFDFKLQFASEMRPR